MPVPQKQIIRFLFKVTAAGVAHFLSACAGAPAQPLPQAIAQTQEIKENSEEGLKLSQENRLEMQTLEARLREMEVQMQLLSDQLALMPMEKIREHERRLDTLQARFDARLPKTSGSPQTSKSRPVDDSASSVASTSLKSPASAVGKDRKGITGPEASLYRKAYDHYAGRSYSEAIRSFEELKSKFPQGAYSDNAEYWIGECHYAQGNHVKAMASFRKVLAMTKTEKDDDAQLKLGYCLLRQGDRKQAAEEFRKFVSLFPGSEYLERAKDELAKLESSGP